MYESRQVDELLMDAVEQMNPLEGAGETASSTWDQVGALSTEN